MRFKELQTILKNEWNLNLVSIDDIDLDEPLIVLAESIACETENKTIDEVYNLNIGHPDLHLPGLIALTIISELDLDPRKFNCHVPLGIILTEKP